MANEKKKKRMNPILWFIFAVIIPVSIVITLIIIILNIAGFDTMAWLKEKGSNVPVVSNMIPTEEEVEFEAREKQLEEMVEERNREISDLTEQMTDQEATIQELEREILRLEKTQEVNLREMEEAEETVDQIKPIAKSYEEMDPIRAAVILQNMSDRETSVSILERMSNDSRGEILQEMDPEIAADLTEKLMAN